MSRPPCSRLRTSAGRPPAPDSAADVDRPPVRHRPSSRPEDRLWLVAESAVPDGAAMSYLAAVLAPAVLLPERLAWFTVVATLVKTPVLVWACREMGGHRSSSGGGKARPRRPRWQASLTGLASVSSRAATSGSCQAVCATTTARGDDRPGRLREWSEWSAVHELPGLEGRAVGATIWGGVARTSDPTRQAMRPTIRSERSGPNALAPRRVSAG